MKKQPGENAFCNGIEGIQFKFVGLHAMNAVMLRKDFNFICRPMFFVATEPVFARYLPDFNVALEIWIYQVKSDAVDLSQ